MRLAHLASFHVTNGLWGCRQDLCGIARDTCKIELVNDADGTCEEQKMRLQRSSLSVRSSAHDVMPITAFMERDDFIDTSQSSPQALEWRGVIGIHVECQGSAPPNGTFFLSSKQLRCIQGTRRLTWFPYSLATEAPLLASTPCVLTLAMILARCLPQGPLCSLSATMEAARNAHVAPSEERGISSPCVHNFIATSKAA